MTNNIDARFDLPHPDAETRKRRVQMGKKIKALAIELDALADVAGEETIAAAKSGGDHDGPTRLLRGKGTIMSQPQLKLRIRLRPVWSESAFGAITGQSYPDLKCCGRGVDRVVP